MRKLIVLLVPLFLIGCAQDYAGINKGSFKYDPKGTGLEVEVIGGKEQGSIRLTGSLPDGSNFEYVATDVKAFEGQAIRAEVEKNLADKGFDVLPDVVETIINTVLKAVGIP